MVEKNRNKRHTFPSRAGTGTEASFMYTCIYCGTLGRPECPVDVKVRCCHPIQTQMLQEKNKHVICKNAQKNRKETCTVVKITSGWCPVRRGHAAGEILRHAERGRLQTGRRKIGKHSGRTTEEDFLGPPFGEFCGDCKMLSLMNTDGSVYLNLI